MAGIGVWRVGSLGIPVYISLGHESDDQKRQSTIELLCYSATQPEFDQILRIPEEDTFGLT